MRLRVGVVGGGLIAQVAHLPTLRRLHAYFEIVALADPSAAVREGVAARHSIEHVHSDWRALLERPDLDALIVCTPHATHAEIVLAGLDAGLHVFVEKPLAIVLGDADRIVERQAESGLTVQVGYMKRYDTAFERLVRELPPSSDGLRLVEAVTFDPGLAREPFFRSDDLIKGHDLPGSVADQGRRALHEQLARAFDSDQADGLEPFSSIYLDALIHDVNLVQGALDQLGEAAPARVLHSRCWDGASGASATLELSNQAQWHSTFMYLDGLTDFRESVTFYFRDAIHSLTFPAPYHQQVPTRYQVLRAEDQVPVEETVQPHQESYVAELLHFHDCVVSGSDCRTPPEQARRDIELLTRMFEAALEHQPIGATP